MKKALILISLLMNILLGCTPIIQSPEEEIQSCLETMVQYYNQENYAQAEVEQERALILVEKVYGGQGKEAADIYLKTAWYGTTYEESIKRTKLAEEIYKNAEDIGGLAKTYYTYGKIYYRISNNELAQSEYEKALEYCDLSKEDMSYIKFHIYLSITGLNIISDETVLLYNMEAEKLIYSLPEEERNEARIDVNINMGNCNYNLNQFKQAIVNYEKVIECFTQYGSEDHGSVGVCFDYCGYSYYIIGEADKAIEYINQSIKILEGLEEVKLWDLSIAYRHLSAIYAYDKKQDYKKTMENGLKSCQIYTEQQELDAEEMRELKIQKDGLKELYEKSPMVKTQDFESWYQENIDKELQY